MGLDRTVALDHRHLLAGVVAFLTLMHPVYDMQMFVNNLSGRSGGRCKLYAWYLIESC